MNKRTIIEKILNGYLVRGKQYHSELSPTLADWYCYTSDGGHSIVCVLKKDFEPGADLSDCLIPVPVKSVLRAFEIKGDYVVVDLPYNSGVGLRIDEEDEEF